MSWFSRWAQRTTDIIHGRNFLDPKESIKNISLIKLESAKDIEKWQLRSDRDIGGLSTVQWEWCETEQAAHFTGTLNLHVSEEMKKGHHEVKSGYSAVLSDFFQPHINLQNFGALEVSVKTDGRMYVLNLTPEQYGAERLLQTYLYAPPGEWTDVILPLSYFMRTWKGYIDGTADSEDLLNISRIGLLMAERADGPFSLYFRSIRAIVHKPTSRMTLLPSEMSDHEL